MTPAEIAAGLTEAQRERLRAVENYGGYSLIRFAGVGLDVRHYGVIRTALRKAGLTLYWNPQYDSLTGIGMKVRAILEKENSRAE